jgi:hypothetical protein
MKWRLSPRRRTFPMFSAISNKNLMKQQGNCIIRSNNICSYLHGRKLLPRPKVLLSCTFRLLEVPADSEKAALFASLQGTISGLQSRQPGGPRPPGTMSGAQYGTTRTSVWNSDLQIYLVRFTFPSA